MAADKLHCKLVPTGPILFNYSIAPIRRESVLRLASAAVRWIEFSHIHVYSSSPSMKSAFERDDLMAILDGIDDAVVKLDGQARFSAMNQAAANIYQRLGLSFFENLKGKSVWEVLPELKGTVLERELRHVIEDHVQFSFEFYYPKDQRWYETKGYPASPGAILVFRDITDKKAAARP